MSHWICCNSCFQSPNPDRKLALTSCGHIICNVCFKEGKHGVCVICNAKCQLSRINDNSSSEVKALFSDIRVVAAKHFSEISKVLMFQTRHKKRLLAHHQKMNMKLEDSLVKMKQEMQQMTKKLNEQSAKINRLRHSLQPQSAQPSSMSQMGYSSYTPPGSKMVRQNPYVSPLYHSRHPSVANINMESMDIDDGSVPRKPNLAPRVSLINSSQHERMESFPYKSSTQNFTANSSSVSATVSCFQGMTSGWKSPIFNPTHPVRHSPVSFLNFPP